MKLVPVVFLLLVPAWATAQERVHTVGDGSDVDPIAVELETEPGLSKPIPGIDIIVRKKPGGTPSRTTTDAGGAFAFANLEPGEYELALGNGSSDPDAACGDAIHRRAAVTRNRVDGAPGQCARFVRGAQPIIVSGIAQEPVTVIWYTGLEEAWRPHIEVTTEATASGNVLRGRISETAATERSAGAGGTEVWLDIDRVPTTRFDDTDVVHVDRVWDDTDIVHVEPGWANPIPGIDVIVQKKPDGRPLRTTTDAGGAFSFANLAPGRYLLELAQPREIPGARLKIYVTAVNDAPASMYDHTITYTGLEIAWSPHVNLNMEVTERGNVLAGRVTNDTTGRDCTSTPRTTLTQGDQGTQDQLRGGPIPGVDVKLKHGDRMFRATTDAHGALSFADLTLGQYVLELAQPASIRETEFVVTENGFAINDKGVQKAWNPHVELKLVATERGNVLRGRIWNETTGRDCSSGPRPTR